jgi:hypothetical protein
MSTAEIDEYAESKGKAIEELTAEEWKEFSLALDKWLTWLYYEVPVRTFKKRVEPEKRQRGRPPKLIGAYEDDGPWDLDFADKVLEFLADGAIDPGWISRTQIDQAFLSDHLPHHKLNNLLECLVEDGRVEVRSISRSDSAPSFDYRAKLSRMSLTSVRVKNPPTAEFLCWFDRIKGQQNRIHGEEAFALNLGKSRADLTADELVKCSQQIAEKIAELKKAGELSGKEARIGLTDAYVARFIINDLVGKRARKPRAGLIAAVIRKLQKEIFRQRQLAIALPSAKPE